MRLVAHAVPSSITDRSRDRTVIHIAQQAPLPRPPKIWQMVPLCNSPPKHKEREDTQSPRTCSLAENQPQEQCKSPVNTVPDAESFVPRSLSENDNLIRRCREDSNDVVRSSIDDHDDVVKRCVDDEEDTEQFINSISPTNGTKYNLTQNIKVNTDDSREYIAGNNEELLERLSRAEAARKKVEDDYRAFTDSLYRKLNEEREVRLSLQIQLQEATNTLHSMPYKTQPSQSSTDA